MSKISKKYFGPDQVDGSILKLEKDQSVRGHKQDGSEVSLFSLDINDNPIVLGSRVALKSEVDGNLQVAKDYSDEKLAAHLNDAEGAHAASAISFDNSGTDIVATNLQTALVEFGTVLTEEIEAEVSRAEGAEQALDARLDLVEPKIIAIESDIADLESFDLELRSDIDDQESYSLDLRSDLDQEILDRQAGDEDTLQSAQDYTDEQIASIPSTDLSNYYNKSEVDAKESALDSRLDIVEPKVSTLESQMSQAQSAISTEQSRAEGAEQALDSRLDIVEPKVSTLESQMSQAQSAISVEQSRAEGAEQELDGRLDIVEPKVSTLESQMSQAQSAISTEQSRAEGAEQALDSRLDIVEPKVSTLESQMSQAQSAISTEQSRAEGAEQALDSRLDIVEPKVSTLESQMSQAQSAISTEQSRAEGAEQALDSRIDALEAQVDGPSFGRFNSVVGSTTSEFMLDRQVKGIMSCANGRVALHEGYDFTVSIDSTTGFSKLTFIGPSAAGGASEIESSDQIFVVYAY
jgi:chaperonin cofactor prefoldin